MRGQKPRVEQRKFVTNTETYKCYARSFYDTSDSTEFIDKLPINKLFRIKVEKDLHLIEKAEKQIEIFKEKVKDKNHTDHPTTEKSCPRDTNHTLSHTCNVDGFSRSILVSND